MGNHGATDIPLLVGLEIWALWREDTYLFLGMGKDYWEMRLL